MICPTHDDVHSLSGLIFTRNVPIIVDKYADIAAIIERCPARSTMAGNNFFRRYGKCLVL
jgi:hypothetical protein